MTSAVQRSNGFDQARPGLSLTSENQAWGGRRKVRWQRHRTDRGRCQAPVCSRERGPGSTDRTRAILRHIARAQVTLPHSEFLEQSHIGTVCTRVQFAAGNGNGEQCPAASIYGHARAITPLLDNPVDGPVFLRSSNHKLPDLVAALGGQISVDLAGKVDTGKGGGIRNTFEVVPDAPVSKFVLSMKGGSKGLLVNSENICRNPQKALAHFVAQNGRVSDTTPAIANDCGGGKGKKKGHRHH